MSASEALKKSIQIISGGNQTRFASQVNAEIVRLNTPGASKLSQQLVHYWLKNEVPCAPQYARIISKLTNGEISPNELRPDVFPPEPEDKAA